MMMPSEGMTNSQNLKRGFVEGGANSVELDYSIEKAFKNRR